MNRVINGNVKKGRSKSNAEKSMDLTKDPELNMFRVVLAGNRQKEGGLKRKKSGGDNRGAKKAETG